MPKKIKTKKVKWPERQGAKCQECPLLKRRAAAPQKVDNPKLVVLGESPGKTEEAVGMPFAGASGALLGDTTRAFGAGDLDRMEDIEVNNAILCRPLPHMSDAEWKKALDCCRPRLINDLKKVAYDRPWTTVMTMGAKAVEAVMDAKARKGKKITVMPWRGYPIEAKREDVPQNLNYMPTLHPAFVLRERHHLPFYKVDWGRGMDINGLSPEEWWPLVDQWAPRLLVETAEDMDEEIRYEMERLLQVDRVAVDVENIPENNHPLIDPVFCIGIGDEAGSISVKYPFPTKEIEAWVREMLASPLITKELQNMNHDWLVLYAHDIEMVGPFDDLLPLTCIMASKVPHGLGEMDVFYHFRERWKTKFHSGDDRKGAVSWKDKPWRKTGDYNGKDCQATDATFKKAWADTDDRERKLYEQSMALADLSRRMTLRGVRFDIDRQQEHLGALTKNMRTEAHEFFEVALTDKKIRQRTLSEFWTYGKDKWWLNKQKNGPKQLFYDILGIEPKHFSKVTGKASLSKNALRDLIGMKDELVSQLAQHMFTWNEWEALAKITAGLRPIDGVIHALWSAALKVTRRWGSSPNMQNLPKAKKARGLPSLRDMLIAREGMWLVEADYSQQELRSIALASGDEIMIQAYLDGANIHDVNTRALFGIEKDDPRWEELRTLAKNFIFGFYYGADTHTNWLNLVPIFPKLDERLIEHIYDTWHAEHPWADVWHKKQVQDARESGYTTGMNGGHRYYHYYGKPKPTVCYNWPIQYEGARQMNAAVLKVDARLRPEDGEHVIMTVHDAIILEGPDKQRLHDILVEEMENVVEFQGRKMEYPVDVSYGKDWGHMTEWEEAA